MDGIDDETRQVAREFVRQALEVSGLTPYAMARRAGISHTTLTRLLNSPDHKVVPKLATLRKVGAVAGLTPPNLGGLELVDVPRPRLVPLVGEARYGTWVEGLSGEDGELPVYLPGYENAALFAVRNAPQPKDTKYNGASVIIAAPPGEVGVRVGDDLIIRRYQGPLSETTVREVVREPNGDLILRAYTQDARHGALPLVVASGETADFEILGVVVGAMREGRYGEGADLPLDL